MYLKDYSVDAGEEVTLIVGGQSGTCLEITLSPRDAREIARALRKASEDAERNSALMERLRPTRIAQ